MSIKRALGHIIPHSHDSSPDGAHSPRSSPSGTHSPRRSLALTNIFSEKEYVSSSDDFGSGDDSEGLSKNAQKRQARKHLREARTRHSLESNEESEVKHKERLEQAEKDQTPEMKARYGELPLVQSTEWLHESRIKLETISEELLDKEVEVRARLHVIRRMGIKLVFLVFRQQIFTIQGVLHDEPGKISPLMIQWAQSLRTGSIMQVRGVLKKPDVPIIGATIHNIEIHITDLKVIVRRELATPFTVYEAELSNIAEDAIEGRHSRISDRTRLTNRIIDLRTGTSQSIFRIQAGVGNLFRSALDEQGFVEIHTPKLQGSATESGASVFKLGYFGRDAFLAQSPQLAKQMAIASDFERVYEIGAIFRAENSNTHRHLTEYTGLDLEMAIESHYHEALNVVDATIKHIFEGVYRRYHKEITIIKEQFPHENLIWLDKTPVIPFAEAVQLLTDSGWLDEDGNPPNPLEDLHTRDEIRLGQLMKEKYHTDYYILDKFPASARPFYTMPDANDPRYTNSFDVFVRGQEIISGGQRIHEPKMLEENMKSVGIDPSIMEEYLEGFRWGAPPHAGAGVGLERIVMLILQIGNIRLASMFPRDPKSFPPKPAIVKLPHPDADTRNPVWAREQKEKGSITSLTDRKLPPIEDLVANYGDATATSWGDERYKIWRHADTGAAMAYVPSHGHAILPGDPLCDPSQYNRIVSSFLTWLKKDTKLKPVWILCSAELEEVLGERLGWKTLSCVAEERVDASKNSALSDADVARKIRHAKNEGVKLVDVPFGEEPSKDLQERADKGVEEWLTNRKGTQIHLSEIHLFRDWHHRKYAFAEDKEGRIVGVSVLAQLAPKHGMQAKYCLDFPGAISGTIELITTHAISVASEMGKSEITFGAGATAHLIPGHHLSGAKIRLLTHAYDAIVKQFHLNRKSEFRAKMGAKEDPLYIAYPPHGLGSKGIRAIMNFFED
ncbi:MAG: hypothetical protein Q9227_007498 [Pyrenula ochraceoflavens]